MNLCISIGIGIAISFCSFSALFSFMGYWPKVFHLAFLCFCRIIADWPQYRNSNWPTVTVSWGNGLIGAPWSSVKAITTHYVRGETEMLVQQDKMSTAMDRKPQSKRDQRPGSSWGAQQQDVGTACKFCPWHLVWPRNRLPERLWDHHPADLFFVGWILDHLKSSLIQSITNAYSTSRACCCHWWLLLQFLPQTLF